MWIPCILHGVGVDVNSTCDQMLDHDGVVEHSSGLIAGLISRADRVFFPADCISHDAIAAIKPFHTAALRAMGE
jgi:hypothetical protein